MKYQPSRITYAIAAAVGAIASTPAAASLIEGTPVAVVSMQEFLISSGLGASVGLTCLWIGKTAVAAIMRGLAAGLRARAKTKAELAASTPGDEDDRAVATSVAIAIAIAEVLDESGKNVRFEKE